MTNMAGSHQRVFALLVVDVVFLSFSSVTGLAQKGSLERGTDIRTVSLSVCTANPSEKTANCSTRYLKEVPYNLPGDILGIDLQRNRFNIIRNSSFVHYQRLTHINLDFNVIYFIESGAFRRLKFLKKLQLASNAMTDLPQIVLCSNRLEYIGLAENQIQNVTSAITIYSTTSAFLDLSKNHVATVNSRAISLLNINTLDLSGIKIIFPALKSLFLGVAKSPIEELAFSRSGYTHIPLDLFDSLRNKSLSKINFLGNKIVLYPFVFANLSGVSLFDLRWNKFKLIQPEYFHGMKALRSLSLSFNSVKILNSNNVMWEINLLYLDLSDNKISALNRYTFHGLDSLTQLILTHNKIKCIQPEYFNGITKLLYLKLDRNLIKMVNQNNSRWTINLQNLNLDSNKIFKLGEYAFHGLNNLTHISLNDNDLHSFEISELSGLNQLTYLAISNTSIPFIISLYAPMLKSVILTDDFELFFYFTILFENLHCLEFVNMTGSSLSSMGSYRFGKISTLKFLYMRRMIGLNIWSGMFRNLLYLLELDLSENNIQVLPTDIFYDLISLRILNLRGNNILRISSLMLKDLSALNELYLDFNKLTYMDNDLFLNHNPNLTKINLAHNHFVSFNQSTFIPLLSTVELIDISNNPLVCNCELRWVIDLFKSKIINSDVTVCSLSSATIDILRGKPLLTFKPDDICGPDIVLISSITIASTGFVIILFIMYHHRWFLRYKMFLIRLAVIGYQEIEDGREREEFDYDINIMFADPDEGWAAETLRPMLHERLPNFDRIAFGDDDLVLGMHYLDAVYENVEKSFKTILLASRAAIEKDIFMTKFRIALNHVTDTLTENVVLVLMEDIPYDEMPYPMRLYLSDGGAYLTWTDDEREQDYFWNELLDRLLLHRRMNQIPPL